MKTTKDVIIGKVRINAVGVAVAVITPSTSRHRTECLCRHQRAASAEFATMILKKPDSNSSCGIDTNCNNDCVILVISFWEKSVGCHLYNRRMVIERNSWYEYGTK